MQVERTELDVMISERAGVKRRDALKLTHPHRRGESEEDAYDDKPPQRRIHVERTVRVSSCCVVEESKRSERSKSSIIITRDERWDPLRNLLRVGNVNNADAGLPSTPSSSLYPSVLHAATTTESSTATASVSSSSSSPSRPFTARSRIAGLSRRRSAYMTTSAFVWTSSSLGLLCTPLSTLSRPSQTVEGVPPPRAATAPPTQPAPIRPPSPVSTAVRGGLCLTC